MAVLNTGGPYQRQSRCSKVPTYCEIYQMPLLAPLSVFLVPPTEGAVLPLPMHLL
jgi:hypothetical protein